MPLLKIAPALVAGALQLIAPASAQLSLVWEDEFNGTALDASRWQPQIGTGCPGLCGWGNNELQYYREENAVVGGGMLRIVARNENFGGRNYTSARLRTANLGDWTYGRFEMRAKLPTGQGIWPAFWLLPTDEEYGFWPGSGEIDVMELVGNQPSTVHGTIHYGSSGSPSIFEGSSYTLPSGIFNDDFHVFAMEWEADEIRWYVDGIQYGSETNWFSGGGPYPAPFDQRFHILVNLAVGGNWPGSPDGTTQFPQEFVVDWVRVWQDLGGCSRPFDDMEHGDPLGNDWFSYSAAGASGGIGADPFNVEPTEGGLVSLAAGWQTGGVGERGGFGRTRPTEAGEVTQFEFWIDPVAGSDWTLRVNLQDDDNADDQIPSTPDGADDEFQAVLTVGGVGSDILAGGGWQKVELPFSAFVDDNSFHFGGNGVLDLVGNGLGGNGRLVNVVFEVASNQAGPVSFNTDGWRFTASDRSIAGRLWSDTNGDGADSGEPGIGAVTLDALDSAGGVAATAVTDAGGFYALDGLGPGAYAVRVRTNTLPGLFTATYDTDGTGTPGETAVVLGCEADAQGVDFGYEPTTLANYCVAGPNSIGPGARLFGLGSTSTAANDFELIATGSVPFTFGIFFYGPNAADQPFGEGRLCVGGSIVRLLPAVGANAFGDAPRSIDFTSPDAAGLAAGSTWRFQYWYRDTAGGPSGFNTSDGLAVTFQP